MLDGLGARIKAQRRRIELTQPEMAYLLDMSLNGYQKYEQGEREPPYETLIKLCDIFECPADVLLGRSDYLRAIGVDVDEYLSNPLMRPKA